MRVGQTSVILFVSKLFTSLGGFLATVYFARVLGAGPLGVYFLAIAVISWLKLFGTVGFRLPLKKRISESDDASQFAAAGLTVALVSFVVLSIPLLIFDNYVNDYIGMDLVEYVLIAFLATVLFRFIAAVLQGQNRVHLYAGLRVVRKTGEVGFQVAAVFLGFGVAGLMGGYIAGIAVGVLIGLYLISVSFRYPRRRQFDSLFSYAKYSWLHSFQGRTFSYMDILVLGFFVTSDLIGIYQVAWMIASFLVIFGSSISQTLFPKLSKLATEGQESEISDLLHESLAYTGLFIIPGLVGGVFLGYDILRIYGDEFTAGTAVLGVLLMSRLVYAYQTQIINTINAVDRPDLGFRVNGAFVVVNLTLNIVLVYLYGWIGAAVATLLSAAVALSLGYYYIARILEFDWPVRKIGKQWASALVMGGVIYALKLLTEILGPLINPTVNTVVLVMVGAAVYFSMLMVLSREFKETVIANSPFS